MHELDPSGVNDVVYALFTLFSCGCWAIFWFLAKSSERRAMRCVVCGQADDEDTPDERRVAARKRAMLEDHAACEREENLNRLKAGIGNAFVFLCQLFVASLLAVGRGLCQVAKRVQSAGGTTDLALARMAGDDKFMHGMLRVTVIALVAVVFSLGMYGLYRWTEAQGLARSAAAERERSETPEPKKADAIPAQPGF